MQFKNLTQNRWFIWSLVAIVVGLGGLASYITVVSQNDSNQISTLDVNHRAKAIPKPTQTTPGFETYTNTKYGFSFIYPDTFAYKDVLLSPKNAGGGDAAPAIMVNFFADRTLEAVKSKDQEIAKTQSNVIQSKVTLGIHQIYKISYQPDIGGNITDYVFSYKGLIFDFGSMNLNSLTEDIILNLK